MDLHIFEKKKLWAALMLFASVTGVSAQECILDKVCADGTNCEAETAVLTWEEAPDFRLSIDGTLFAAERFAAGVERNEFRAADTTWFLRNENPVIEFNNQQGWGAITSDGSSDSVTLSLMPSFTSVRRYLEYSEAMSERKVFNGVCEGLF